MSIKEKGEEIKSTLEGLGARLRESGKGTSIAILLTLIASVIGSYSLGFSAGKGTLLPERVPLHFDAALTSAPLEPTPSGVSNESNTISSHMVGVPTTSSSSSQTNAPQEAKTYVASRKGSKYHLPSCPGAKAISEENKVWFGSKEEAEAKGYTPAANCKGI